MIAGIGVDIVEVARMEQALERFGDRFAQRVLAPEEWPDFEAAGQPAAFLAKRFAAKEAGMKAIGTGWRRGVGWHDFEVVRERSGRPTLQFHGKAAEFARALGVERVALSLTHTHQYGMAFVILEGGRP